MLWVVMLLCVAACSTPGSTQGSSAEGAQPSSGEESSVAYGASLDEWEEAAQDEDAQNANPEADVSDSASEETVADAVGSDADGSDADANDEAAAEEAADSDENILFELDNVVYRQIMWDGLIPADFTPASIMGKYVDEIAALEDGSPEATELYEKMQEEFNNAPVNEVLNEVEVRIPGFIAPLDYTNDTITEFLLVPYFGACIHVPPPPVNQTVMVTTAEGHGIKIKDSNNPFWVMGKIVTEGTTTDLAAAGYNITEAIIEPYTSSE